MIIYRDGKEIHEIKDFKVVGKFMEVATLDCTIKSPTPIEFKIGDYVVYDYNGLTYSLYDIPTPKKQARSGSYGEAFIYELKFKSNMEQLSICPFLDIVANDNGLHYTSLPSFSTFENVYGIATRVQANMDYLYPNKWRIVVADTDDPELLETLNEAKDFSISGQSCLEGLKKVYETWGVGFIHTVSDGLNIITIGKSAGTTSLFRYGKGQGLRTIKKSLQNSDQFCTRVYAYGSTRNIPARWYNEKGYIGEAQYAPYLMIPPSKWADGKPQGAYIDAVFGDENRVEKYGLRIKIFSYDGSNGRDEIFPSIEKVTAGNIRTAKQELGETKYTPSAAYSDAERMDYILEGSNIEDDGTTVQAGYNLYSDSIKSEITPASGVFVIAEDKGDGTYRQLSLTEEIPICRFNITKLAEYKVGAIDNILTFEKNEFESTVNVEFFMKRPTGDYLKLSQVPYLHQGSAQIVVPLVESEFSAAIEGVYTLVARVTVGWSETYVNPLIPDEPVDLNYTVSGGEALVYRGAKTLKSTFTIKLKQIGFDLNTVKASDGSAKTISFKSGMCSGRSFVITRCEYSASDDSWVLTCRRGVDSSVSQTFPNSIFPISAGDQFILLNINMPDLYVHTAMQRLYDTALADLKHYSNPQFVVSPEIDNLQMARSPQTLKEGMYMPVEDADINIDDDILIDGVTITEKGNELRRFDVTLRNDKIYNRFSKIATSLSNLESSIEEAKKNANNTPLTSGEDSIVLGGSSPQISIWEHINVGTEENPKYAIVPKQYKGEDVGILSDTFITAKGVNEDDDSSLFSVLNDWSKYNGDPNEVLSANLGYELLEMVRAFEGTGGSGGIDVSILEKYLTKSEAEKTYTPLTTFNTYKETTDKRLESLEAMFGWYPSNEERESIKANAGLWTDSFVTARGINGNLDGEVFVRLDRWEDYNADSDEGQVLSAKLGWELLQMVTNGSGSGSVDLTGYVKTEELNTKLKGYYTKTEVNNTLNGYQPLISSSNKIPYNYISGTPTIPSTSNFLSINGGTINGDLRLQKTGENYGTYLRFGDSNYAYIAEINDDELTIKATEIHLNGSVFVNGVAYSGGSDVDLDNYVTFDDLDGYAETSWVSDNFLSLDGGEINGSLDVNGSFYATSITHGSDIRHKSILNDIAEDVDFIANAPLFNFTWDNDADKTPHLGTSAQYWLNTELCKAVSYDKKNDFYGLAYGELGVAMGILNARKIVSHEERIKVLEAENAALKTELNGLRRRIG